MIQDMTPQAYPLWAVEKTGENALLVIGWASSDDPIMQEDTVHPVVTLLGTGGIGAWVGEDVQVFLDHREALHQVSLNRMENLARSARS